MIKNFGDRLQNTWQNLRGANTQSEAAGLTSAPPNTATAPGEVVRTTNERSIAGRLRQRLQASRLTSRTASAGVVERDVPVQKHLRVFPALAENGLEPLAALAISGASISASPLLERPPLVSSDYGLSVFDVRAHARIQQRTNRIAPTLVSTDDAEISHKTRDPESFDHIFSRYDQTFPFQSRSVFDSEKKAHDMAKKHGLKAHDYTLTTEYFDDEPEPFITMELRSTIELKQGGRQFPFDPSDAFNAAKRQLRSDAVEMMQNFVPSPTRPAVRLPQNSSMQTLFKTVLNKSDALVIGECHSDLASKKAVIDTMPTLCATGVTHFFLEHVPADTFRNDIDKYNRAPAGSPIPERLEAYLEKLDEEHLSPSTRSNRKSEVHDVLVEKYGFKAMVKAIHDGGVELCCIDREISYHVPSNFRGYSVDGSYERGMTFNCLAAQQKARLPMGAKSVWFIGETHANTHKGVPGQAELHNGIAVMINDKHEDTEETGLRANVKNYRGCTGLNPDLVMVVDLSLEEAAAVRLLQQK